MRPRERCITRLGNRYRLYVGMPSTMISRQTLVDLFNFMLYAAAFNYILRPPLSSYRSHIRRTLNQSVIDNAVKSSAILDSTVAEIFDPNTSKVASSTIVFAIPYHRKIARSDTIVENVGTDVHATYFALLNCFFF